LIGPKNGRFWATITRGKTVTGLNRPKTAEDYLSDWSDQIKTISDWLKLQNDKNDHCQVHIFDLDMTSGHHSQISNYQK